jgi:hypothetical protein
VQLARLSSGGSSVSSVATAAPADDPVSAYDAFLAEFLAPVADAGSRIGGEVSTSSSFVLQCEFQQSTYQWCTPQPCSRQLNSVHLLQVAAVTSCMEKAFKAVRTVLAIAAAAKVGRRHVALLVPVTTIHMCVLPC